MASAAVPHSSIAEILRRHSERLLAVPGVVGAAEGLRDGRPCILVLVSDKGSATDAAIPDELEGVPLQVVETGGPEAFGSP